jgi:hypothetical protein
MKTVFVVLCLVVLTCSLTQAGMIYGVVKVQAKHVGAGVKIEVLSAGAVTDSARTDTNGTYQLVIKTQGKISLRVIYEGKTTPPIEIYTYDQPARYNLILEAKDGAYMVRRE